MKIFHPLQDDNGDNCNADKNQVIQPINDSDIIDCITKKIQNNFINVYQFPSMFSPLN